MSNRRFRAVSFDDASVPRRDGVRRRERWLDPGAVSSPSVPGCRVYFIMACSAAAFVRSGPSVEQARCHGSSTSDAKPIRLRGDSRSGAALTAFELAVVVAIRLPSLQPSSVAGGLSHGNAEKARK